MGLIVQQRALQAAEGLQGVLPIIRKRDKDLFDQVRRAMNSVVRLRNIQHETLGSPPELVCKSPISTSHHPEEWSELPHNLSGSDVNVG